jgi:hypothetical protein
LAGEPALIHGTQGTGDIELFAICPENYNPVIVAQMRDMITKPVMGYLLEEHGPDPDDPEAGLFFVIRHTDGARLIKNSVRRDGQNVVLTTTIVSDQMAEEEAYMLANLEQCAALMLVDVKP